MVPAIAKKTVLLWLFLLAACTIRLVPSYDQALVDGLTQANVETLTLFAELENGAETGSFSQYQGRYASLIGQFEALKQRAETRDIPPLAKRLSTLKLVDTICNAGGDPTACVNTSPASMARVLVDLRKMRDVHRSTGLASDIVGNFRNDYATAIAQALTVENALKL